MLGNGPVRFGGRPHGKGPAQRAPRRAAHPVQFYRQTRTLLPPCPVHCEHRGVAAFAAPYADDAFPSGHCPDKYNDQSV